jgi:hypothetical protein
VRIVVHNYDGLHYVAVHVLPDDNLDVVRNFSIDPTAEMTALILCLSGNSEFDSDRWDALETLSRRHPNKSGVTFAVEKDVPPATVREFARHISAYDDRDAVMRELGPGAVTALGRVLINLVL